MVGIILVAENNEAHEMLKTARRLLGRTSGIGALILKSGKSVETMQNSLKKAIKQADYGSGVLLLTDFYGSTQCNVCMKYVKKGLVELLTGFNLPMLVKLGTLQKTMALKELVPFIEKYGKNHIRHIYKKKL